jgi:hypothetical protein
MECSRLVRNAIFKKLLDFGDGGDIGTIVFQSYDIPMVREFGAKDFDRDVRAKLSDDVWCDCHVDQVFTLRYFRARQVYISNNLNHSLSPQSNFGNHWRFLAESVWGMIESQTLIAGATELACLCIAPSDLL